MLELAHYQVRFALFAAFHYILYNGIHIAFLPDHTLNSPKLCAVLTETKIPAKWTNFSPSHKSAFDRAPTNICIRALHIYLRVSSHGSLFYWVLVVVFIAEFVHHSLVQNNTVLSAENALYSIVVHRCSHNATHTYISIYAEPELHFVGMFGRKGSHLALSGNEVVVFVFKLWPSCRRDDCVQRVSARIARMCFSLNVCLEKS